MEELIQFPACLHLIEPLLLRAAVLQRAKKLLARFHSHAKSALRENHDFVTELGQLRKREQRALPELRHVRYQGGVEFLRKIAKLLRTLQRFWKNCIRPCFQIFPSTVKRPIKSFDRPRIGPRDD